MQIVCNVETWKYLIVFDILLRVTFNYFRIVHKFFNYIYVNLTEYILTIFPLNKCKVA